MSSGNAGEVPIVSADPASPSSATGNTALTASIWTLVGYGAAQVIRIAGNVRIAEILLPDAFGQSAIIGVFLVGLQMFSDIGIGANVIQSRHGGNRGFLDTAWTVQVIRGFILFAGALSFSYPFALFYADRNADGTMADSLLLWVVASSFTVLIAGFNSTKLYTMKRELQQKRLMIVNLTAQISQPVVAVLWAAYLSRTVWALVVSGIFQSLVTLVLSHLALPGERNRFRWDPAFGREIIRFGRWIFLSSILHFFVTQADRLFFGKKMDHHDFGLYGIAANLATAVAFGVSELGGSVINPLYSKIKNSSDKLSVVIGTIRAPVLCLGGWGSALLIAAGPYVVQVLYLPEFHEAGWYLRFLAIAGWFLILEITNNATLLACGLPSALAGCNFVKICALPVLVSVGYWYGGVHGAVFGLIGSDAVKYVASAAIVHANGFRSWVQDLRYFIILSVSCLAGYESGILLEGWGAASWLTCLSVFAVVTALWLPVALRQYARWRRAR